MSRNIQGNGEATSCEERKKKKILCCHRRWIGEDMITLSVQILSWNKCEEREQLTQEKCKLKANIL